MIKTALICTIFLFVSFGIQGKTYFDYRVIRIDEELVVCLDRMKLRQQPDLSSPTIRLLSKGETVYFTGNMDRKDESTPVTINGIHFDYRFYHVRLKEGTKGWVHGSGLIYKDLYQNDRIDILNVGDNEISIVKLKLHNWIGLFDIDGSYELKKVMLRSKPGTYGGEAFGTTFVTTNLGQPVMLIRNLIPQQIGKVETAHQFVGKEDIVPGRHKLEFLGTRYELEEKKTYTFVEYDGVYRDYGFELTLHKYGKNGSVTSSVVSRSISGQHRFVWAGDIDGDGELDLLVDRDNVAWGEINLLLSSKATGDDLVKNVANTNSWSMN